MPLQFLFLQREDIFGESAFHIWEWIKCANDDPFAVLLPAANTDSFAVLPDNASKMAPIHEIIPAWFLAIEVVVLDFTIPAVDGRFTRWFAREHVQEVAVFARWVHVVDFACEM